MTTSEPPEDQERQIRVLIAHMQGTLAPQIVQHILEQPDMLLVGQIQNQINLLLAIDMGVDVLLMTSSDVIQLPGIGTHLLSEYPHLRIIVIESGQAMAMMYWLGLRQRELSVVSTETLLDDIRYAFVLNPVI